MISFFTSFHHLDVVLAMLPKFILINSFQQEEMKRTVPREEMLVQGVQRTRKILVCGTPTFFTEGNILFPSSVLGMVSEYV